MRKPQVQDLDSQSKAMRRGSNLSLRNPGQMSGGNGRGKVKEERINTCRREWIRNAVQSLELKTSISVHLMARLFSAKERRVTLKHLDKTLNVKIPSLRLLLPLSQKILQDVHHELAFIFSKQTKESSPCSHARLQIPGTSLQTAKTLQLQTKPMKIVPWTNKIPCNGKHLQQK